ncbi:MAG TPA: flagellar hook-basal body complex protein [Chloroflexota bacterium]|nr:flagellar hook-basal body complex protein [Chloroflexota bacterium]
MWTSLRTAVTGMRAQQRALDTAADNLSKMQVPGSRSQRVSFAEMAPELTYLGVPDGKGNVLVDARETGKGVKASAMLQDLSQGIFLPTEDPMDIAIDGDGMLEVTLPDGRVAYTLGASLRVDGAGRLMTATGATISPQIQVPEGTASLEVEEDGSVVASGPEGDPQTIGQLKLVRFANPEGLQLIGGNVLLPTVASGAPIEGAAGEPGIGTVVSRVIESSNIDAREEYLRIVQAQRAYQLNIRALTTMDEMLQEANNLRRS